MRVGLGAVGLEGRVVHHDDLVRAEAGELVAQLGDVAAEQNGGNLGLHGGGQLSGLADQLKRNAGDFVVDLLDEHIHTLIILQIHSMLTTFNILKIFLPCARTQMMNFSLSFSSM